MESLISKYCPNVIFHAAAYKHVPLMEANPYEAVYTNVFGTKVVADLAIKYGVEKFVMISTDKAVRPTSVMGATKRMAEIYVQSRRSKTSFVTTRFGNVLGSSGSVIPIFRKQIKEGGPVTITHKEVVRYFMTIPEACRLVLEACSLGNGNDILVFDMGEPVKIYDLAKNMIQITGAKVDIVEIGLRPGEKLYEELLWAEEETLPTSHEKIKHAKVIELPTESVDKYMGELYQVLQRCDAWEIVSKIKEMIPEYKSQNSDFQRLDKKIKEEEQVEVGV
jgi:FlaA1/EpsC-like NDP-sugar epimerase